MKQLNSVWRSTLVSREALNVFTFGFSFMFVWFIRFILSQHFIYSFVGSICFFPEIKQPQSLARLIERAVRTSRISSVWVRTRHLPLRSVRAAFMWEDHVYDVDSCAVYLYMLSGLSIRCGYGRSLLSPDLHFWTFSEGKRTDGA